MSIIVKSEFINDENISTNTESADSSVTTSPIVLYLSQKKHFEDRTDTVDNLDSVTEIHNKSDTEERTDNEMFFKSHSAKNVTDTLYFCSICKTEFNCSKSCKRHVQRVHGKKTKPSYVHENKSTVKCNYSDERIYFLPYPRTARQRTYVFKKNKEHFCDICNKGFVYKGQLITHYRLHTGEKPFECDVCGKRFSKNHYLKQHYRVHTGHKPYKCEVCSKCFSAGPLLRRHFATHTGERKYICKGCDKCYTRKAYLQAHHQVCKLYKATLESSTKDC